MRVFGEKFGENACFVAPTAGQIEEAEMILLLDVRPQEIPQVLLESREILLKEISEGSVGHGRTLEEGFGLCQPET